MNDLETRKAQVEKDIELLQEEKAKIEQQLEAQNPKWIAAISEQDRLILNIPALSVFAKECLKFAIEKNHVISICDNGRHGASGKCLGRNPLTFYTDTKIVFGGE